MYKTEKYIYRCVNSILQQTYKNLEIILVDDGSPDKCGEICDEYQKIDSRVKVIHKENAGVSAARNSGLDIASGEYISFVDSDDYLDKNLFFSCYKYILKWAPDLIDWGINFVSCDGNVIREQLHTLPKDKLLGRQIIVDEILPQLVHIEKQNDSYLGAWITNKLFKREVLKKKIIRFDTTVKLWEDGIFTIEYLKYCNNIVCMQGKYYNYRDTPNSLSTKFDSNLYLYALKIYEKYREMFDDTYDFNSEFSKEYRFQLAHGIIMRTFNFVHNGLSYCVIRSEILKMLNNQLFCRYFTEIQCKNPVIHVIQTLVTHKCYKGATNLYILYHMIKSIMDRK